MSRRAHSARSHALRVLAIVLIVVGVVSVAGYGLGVLSTIGEADQSLTFWLLPFLLGGLAMAGVGTVLLVLWLILVSSERSDRAP